MTESTTEQGTIDRDAALKKAYQQATAALRDEQRERFNVLYSEKALALGVEWKPKQTAEEKAEEEFQRLLAQYPHLAEKVQQDQPQQAEGVSKNFETPTPDEAPAV